MAEFQSAFGRTLLNESKMGAYYTDISHCEDISKFLEYPDEEIDVLEPSCGDCSAVLTVTKKAKANIYGVELNDTTYKECLSLQKEGKLKKVVNADFVTGVRVDFNENTKFNLCFSNPPYMNDSNERLEKIFLREITNYLSNGSVLIWIVSESTYLQDLKYILSNYELKYVYRFRKSEYEKWHQVVAFLVKKKREMASAEMVAEVAKLTLCELPKDFDGEKIKVKATGDNIKIFESKRFDINVASKFLEENQPFVEKDITDFYESALKQKEFLTNTKKTPLTNLSDGHIALAITCGEGQGEVGSKEDKNLHLMRGTCKVVEEDEFAEDDTDINGGKLTVKSFSKMSICTIQPSGKIVRFM